MMDDGYRFGLGRERRLDHHTSSLRRVVLWSYKLREQWHKIASFDLGTHFQHVNPLLTTDVWDYKLNTRITITNFVITLRDYHSTYYSDVIVAHHRATFGKGAKIHVRVYGRSKKWYVRQGPGTAGSRHGRGCDPSLDGDKKSTVGMV